MKSQEHPVQRGLRVYLLLLNLNTMSILLKTVMFFSEELCMLLTQAW